MLTMPKLVDRWLSGDIPLKKGPCFWSTNRPIIATCRHNARHLECRECPAFASDLGSFIGDGFCDSFVAFNSPECFFDGGDCCIDTVGLLGIPGERAPGYLQDYFHDFSRVYTQVPAGVYPGIYPSIKMTLVGHIPGCYRNTTLTLAGYTPGYLQEYPRVSTRI